MHPMDILDRINRFGIERSERELVLLAAAARRAGVADAIASALTDRTVAPIARERAAARTVAAINAAPRRSGQFIVAA